SKQTERAESMRSVHPSFVGFICVSQSADTGETGIGLGQYVDRVIVRDYLASSVSR
ncbi:MAG: hypothetical protein EBV02_03530, partial [Actinobacteria bacterium]|nr:hypothetical protein [Actinomycetota bacterium]